MTTTTATNPNADHKSYLLGLQDRITQAIEALDGRPFLSDHWSRPPGSGLQGDGITRILEDGNVFERAGCGFSHVIGHKLPLAATQQRPDLAGRPFSAMGVSLVFHPRNPYVPTVHMNVRNIRVQKNSTDSISWYGGGLDLTPFYGFVEDAVHFHQVCRAAVKPFGSDLYPRFKKWCDDYFYLKHRNEPRGIGGLFFDDFSELGAEQDQALWQAIGNCLLDAYLPIVMRRKDMPYGDRQIDHQRYRRGRYVEFNLIWDRGTHFGLQSGGRTESILLSMPRHASWAYQHRPESGSPEDKLQTEFLIARDWLKDAA